MLRTPVDAVNVQLKGSEEEKSAENVKSFSRAPTHVCLAVVCEVGSSVHSCCEFVCTAVRRVRMCVWRTRELITRTYADLLRTTLCVLMCVCVIQRALNLLTAHRPGAAPSPDLFLSLSK